MESAKRRLARGPHPLDNRELLCNLLDVMEGGCSHTNDSVQQSENVTGTGSEVPRQTVPALPMLDHSGMFAKLGLCRTDDKASVITCFCCVGFYNEKDNSAEDETLLICERRTFRSLCIGLTQLCQCQAKALKLTSTLQVHL